MTVCCSCNKTTSLPEYNEDPVLTSYLSPWGIFDLQLAHQQSTSSEAYHPPGLDSLTITVSSNDTSYVLTSLGKGEYENGMIPMKAGTKYDLSFSYNGKIVTTSTVIPSKPVNFAESVSEISITQQTASSFPGGTPGTFPDPVKLTWDNPDASYYLVVVKNLETNPARISDTVLNSSDTSITFGSKPSITNTYSINPNSFKYFGKHRIVLFHINPDYASLYSDNNSSSQNLSTPSTGIINGVGIFTAINADTLYLQVDKK